MALTIQQIINKTNNTTSYIISDYQKRHCEKDITVVRVVTADGGVDLAPRCMQADPRRPQPEAAPRAAASRGWWGQHPHLPSYSLDIAAKLKVVGLSIDPSIDLVPICFAG
jgi:hypothetical protein